MTGREQRHPEPAVGAMILNRMGEMLLVRSHKWADKLTVAGGHVEVGETLEAALVREIREEVGLDVTDVQFLLVQEAIYSTEFWRPRHFIFFDFICRAVGESPTPDGAEIQSCSWVSPKKALRLDLDTYTRRMVEAYLARGGHERAANLRRRSLSS